ncbi:MAG TPA: V-type ATP synthase subunit D [Prolixibacteraceae bacterium]|nr:V-type ATP synthase subunit D [Prolixibacteraceae bacterium]
MTIKFQYNKIALQSLNKQLNIRLRTLPTLKNKEATLRFEVEKARKIIKELDDNLAMKFADYTKNPAIWGKFIPDLITVGEVKTTIKTIAGLKTPQLDEIIFRIEEFSLFNKPKWFPDGISKIKVLVSIAIERDVIKRKTELLNHARRKTTQKVNLYEKVQIPAYEDAIMKIKRFMEDEENLSKSAQKILKKRQQQLSEIDT